MKVRIYDSCKKDCIDRYTLYFPYPKKEVERTMKSAHRRIMGVCQPFNFVADEMTGKTTITFYSWVDDDRTLGVDIPGTEKKIPIKAMPKEVQDYAAKMEKLWNDAWKYNDDEHWHEWNIA